MNNPMTNPVNTMNQQFIPTLPNIQSQPPTVNQNTMNNQTQPPPAPQPGTTPKPQTKNKPVPNSTFKYSKKSLEGKDTSELEKLFDRLDKLIPTGESGVTEKEKTLDTIVKVLDDRKNPPISKPAHHLPLSNNKDSVSELPPALSFINQQAKAPTNKSGSLPFLSDIKKEDTKKDLPNAKHVPKDDKPSVSEKYKSKFAEKAAVYLHNFTKSFIKTFDEVSRDSKYDVSGVYDDLYGTEESEDDIKDAWKDTIDEYPDIKKNLTGKNYLGLRISSSVLINGYNNYSGGSKPKKEEPKKEANKKSTGDISDVVDSISKSRSKTSSKKQEKQS